MANNKTSPIPAETVIPDFFLSETKNADGAIGLKNVATSLFAGVYKQGGEMLESEEVRSYYADFFVAVHDLIDACYQHNQTTSQQ
jgi:hypothetical protein